MFDNALREGRYGHTVPEQLYAHLVIKNIKDGRFEGKELLWEDHATRGGWDDDGNEKSARLRLKERGSPICFEDLEGFGDFNNIFRMIC